MSHEIDMSNNRANVAYFGDSLWHRLGHEMQADATLEQWVEQAGLSFGVKTAPVQFHVEDSAYPIQSFPSKKILYRDDTNAALGIVSDQYHIVQPEEVVGFFRDLVEAGKFQMETAGSLFGGKRIWGLAKAGEGQEVTDGDVILPYLLMATSFDGTFATQARFTSIRVQCNNTLTVANTGEDKAYIVRIPHISRFYADSVKAKLGLLGSQFDSFMSDLRTLSEKQISGRQFDSIITESLCSDPDGIEDFRSSKVYESIAALFEGEGIGISGKRTAYDLINAITEYFDHGKNAQSAENRLNRTWFGSSESDKNKVCAKIFELA